MTDTIDIRNFLGDVVTHRRVLPTGLVPPSWDPAKTDIRRVFKAQRLRMALGERLDTGLFPMDGGF